MKMRGILSKAIEISLEREKLNNDNDDTFPTKPGQ